MRIEELNEQKVGEILTWLSHTDEAFAVAKVELESAEILRKRVRMRIFKAGEGEGSVAERNAEAEIHEDTQMADDAYLSALRRFEVLRAKRQRAEQLVEVWRSLEASRRKAIMG